MDLVFIGFILGIVIQGSGLTARVMVLEFRNVLMEAAMLENSSVRSSMVWGATISGDFFIFVSILDFYCICELHCYWGLVVAFY